MQAVKQQTASEFGHELVDSIAIPETMLNILFVALLLTAIGVFLGGNLLLLDVSVLQRSAQIALPCFAMLLIFYAFARSVGSVTWGLVLIYGLMWVVVYSRQMWLIPTVYALAVLGLVYAIRFLRVDRQQWRLVLLMAVIATATVLGCDRAYTSFDMLHRLHAGNVHQDTLFHASIAAMIKNYGVASTGLHGLVETPYHVLSHVLMASISLLSGLGVIEVYGVANWVLFAPILIFGVVACCAMLDRVGYLNMPLAWGVVCVLLVACPFLFSRWVVDDSFFISESYLVSLGLFLLGLPLLFKHKLSVADLLLVLVLTALISSAKASVGLILIGLWFVRMIFVRGESVFFEFLAFLLAFFAACWVVLDSARANTGSIAIFPLHFIAVYSFLGVHVAKTGKALLMGSDFSWLSLLFSLVSILSFFIFHFVLSWIVIAQVAYSKGAFSLIKVPVAVYSIAAVLAGTMVILLFAIGGGSAGYFSNVAFFVALPAVVFLLACWIDQQQLKVPLFLFVGILLVCVLSVKGFYKVSAFLPSRSVQSYSTFIDSLMELRDRTPTHVVIQFDATIPAHNPITRCTAQPFVFPAVSERPWLGVIAARNDCTYYDYGYSGYGITHSQQRVTVQPQLLPGMNKLSWPSVTTDPQSSRPAVEK